ncbi:hypothetical protein ASPACDRAFT_51746 [Aspergillus aculeatus ATCC 16872]|uniref:DNA polymerase V n=1 Tax=Aspergillus aculeatus (strain ATCC 16872 / CBS 172.66 / WB 5094) TaxID=690307 RepID=A0A1L9WXF6_ASPA1|nr:uncharacterized protein ASPACDRAFT_51746 [Aspergillus aculeatus ATCC 16872]OJK00955.1 hypothetical protein ASPACDRAFT_51746 [Aspergillus aculeatus ATCC 16872]
MATRPAGPPPTKKRRREPVSVDRKQIEIYEDLASETDAVRLKAAAALVAQFTPDQNPAAEAVDRALARLFRGLCSSRKAARVGFSIALTEVLVQVYGAASGGKDVGAVLGVWERLTDSAGGESGQEQRDHYFGRLFGAEAIIKSGILFGSGAGAGAGAAAPAEWTRLLDRVFELAKKKPWLREECGWIVYRCVLDLASSQKKDQVGVKLVEVALERLCAHDLAKTPEGVAVWLAAKEAFPSVKFPAKVWKHEDPLDAKERVSLGKVMKDSSDSSASSGEDGDGQKKGSGAAAANSGVWNSKLHFAWDVVLGRLAQVPKAKAKGESRLGFAEFWTEVVDNGLFAAASSEERKYWGFSLFIKVVTESPQAVAAQTFTKNLVRCLMNQLAVEDRYLHRMAVKAAKSLQTRVAKEPAFAAAAVRGLMGPATGGSVTFDQATKTKTVEKIVVEANVDALKEIVPLFESLIAAPCGPNDSKTAAASRQFLAGLLLAIVRARASADSKDDDTYSVLEQILSIFVRFAYFKDPAVSPALTEQTQELFRSRINSCINSLIATARYASIPYAVVRQIRDLAKSEERGKFIVSMDETISGAVKNAFKSLKKLASMKKDNAASVDAFRLLYSLTILQVYNGDADAASMLEELDFCYTQIFGEEKKKDKKKSKGKKAEDEEEEEEEEEEDDDEKTSDASDALVEILLSFASKQSQLFRRMSEQVFGAFAESITENGLESLTSILEAKESLAGQQEMFDQQDEDGDADMMDVDADGDGDELDSDVEVVEAGDGGSESSTSSDSELSDDEGNDDEEAIFEAKLAAALGTHRLDADMPEAEEDSDADMNDDEMEELDEQLVKVFRARRDALGQKKDKKDARANMVHFKNRVLDLLEIYVKKCHAKLLALDLLLPLLRLTRKSSNKQISTRAANVLREYTKQCKGATALPAIAEEDVDNVWELLKSIHTEATHSGPPAHATACSQASLLVVKVLVAQERGNVARVVEVYGETRTKQLLSRKCHVQPSFFTDWNNWCVSFGKMKN